MSKGVRVTFIIPFDGDVGLLSWRPSGKINVNAEAEFKGAEIWLVYEYCQGLKVDVKAMMLAEADRLEQQCRGTERLAETTKGRVKNYILPQVSEKKNSLDERTKLMQDIGVPVREGATKVNDVPARNGPEGDEEYDCFISHASEDKDFVEPLAERLRELGLTVWYDKFVLKIGDSLRESIDRGLASSRYGVVVISHAFFTKRWP